MDKSQYLDFGENFEKRIREVFSSETNRELVGELAYDNFRKYYGCSQSILQAFMDVLGLKDPFWFKALGGLQAGGCCGFTCGALNTGIILISAIKGRQNIQEGFNGIVPAFEPCQKLGQWFKIQYKSTVCSEISGYNWFDLMDVMMGHLSPTPKQKERLEDCARLAGGTASQISDILNQMV